MNRADYLCITMCAAYCAAMVAVGSAPYGGVLQAWRPWTWDWDALSAIATTVAVVVALRGSIYQAQITRWSTRDAQMRRLLALAEAASIMIEAVETYRVKRTPEQLTRIKERLAPQYDQLAKALEPVEVDDVDAVRAQVVLRACFIAAGEAVKAIVKGVAPDMGAVARAAERAPANMTAIERAAARCREGKPSFWKVW